MPPNVSTGSSSAELEQISKETRGTEVEDISQRVDPFEFSLVKVLIGECQPHQAHRALVFPRKNALEARVGIGQGNPKNAFKIPSVYGPFNHLLKYSNTVRKMPDTDDSTDGGLRWFYTPAQLN